MSKKKIFFRVSAFFLVLFLLVESPASDYFGAKKAYALPLAIPAVEYVFDVLFHIVGVDALDNTRALIDDMQNWVNSNPNDPHDYRKIMLMLSAVSYGSALVIGQNTIDMVRDYFKSKKGYGTDVGMDKVVVSNSDFLSFNNSYLFHNCFDYSHIDVLEENYVFSGPYGFLNPQSSSPLPGYDFFLPNDFDFEKYKLVACVDNSFGWKGFLFSYDPVSDTIELLNLIRVHTEILNGIPLITSDLVDRWDFSNADLHPEKFCFPTVLSKTEANHLSPENMLSWIHKPNSLPVVGDWPIGTDGSIWDNIPTKVGVPVISIPDIQSRPIQIAGEFSVPANAEEAHAKYIEYSGATTADEMAAAMAGAAGLDITYGDSVPAEGEGEENPALPWLPDITGPLKGVLEHLKSIVNGIQKIGDWVMTIPSALVDIKNGIIAIPGQITGFFSIDTDVIALAYDELIDTFHGRFSGLGQLSSVFHYDGRVFNQTPPVFSIPTPDALKFEGVGSEIVILDLRPYVKQFSWCRNLLVAMFWVMFARWLLNQFDVKFHIG